MKLQLDKIIANVPVRCKDFKITLQTTDREFVENISESDITSSVQSSDLSNKVAEPVEKVPKQK